MASNNSSADNNPYQTTWGGFGSYGSIPTGPSTELRSTPSASAGVLDRPDPDLRVASPGTQARQQEMGLLFLAEQQRYLNNANASEAGSMMERHMMNFMHELEDHNSMTAPQAATSTTHEAITTTTHQLTTTDVVDSGSYLNHHGRSLNDERRRRIEQGANVAGQPRSGNDQGYDVNDTSAPEDQASNVEGHNNARNTQAPHVNDTNPLEDQANSVEGQATSRTNQGRTVEGQTTSADDQEHHANHQRSNLREVNFTAGIYGRITQVEQNTHVTYGGHTIVTSAGLDSCNPSTYATANDPSNDLNGHTHTTRSDTNISEASSTSTLRRRAAFNDLAHEAGHEHTPFEYDDEDENQGDDVPDISDTNILAAHGLSPGSPQENIEAEDFDQAAGHENHNVDASGGPVQTSTQDATVLVNTSGTTSTGTPPTEAPFTYAQNTIVESTPPSPSAVPEIRQPIPANDQRPPRLTNGVHRDNHTDQNHHAAASQNGQNIALPPHFDVNDPVGADFMAALQDIRRVAQRIGALGADPTATSEVQGILNIATTALTIGFRRSAAAARDHRESHQVTTNDLNGARLAARGIQREYQGAVEALERTEERLALAEEEREVLRARLAAARFAAARSAALAAALRGRLAQRRAENRRLLGEVAEMERTLYGHD